MNRNLISGLLILLIFSCTSKYKYWDISEFKIRPGTLQNNEEIRIIYISGGPDFNPDLNYYYHIIVVSQSSGDTVNVLTTADNGFKEEDRNKVFNYFTADNFSTKISREDNNQDKKISQVARDPAFDHLAYNNYPTVIGFIGTITRNTDK